MKLRFHFAWCRKEEREVEMVQSTFLSSFLDAGEKNKNSNGSIHFNLLFFFVFVFLIKEIGKIKSIRICVMQERGEGSWNGSIHFPLLFFLFPLLIIVRIMIFISISRDAGRRGGKLKWFNPLSFSPFSLCFTCGVANGLLHFHFAWCREEERKVEMAQSTLWPMFCGIEMVYITLWPMVC